MYQKNQLFFFFFSHKRFLKIFPKPILLKHLFIFHIMSHVNLTARDFLFNNCFQLLVY